MPSRCTCLKAKQQAGELVLDAIQRATQPEAMPDFSALVGEQIAGGPGDTAACMLPPASGMPTQRKGTFERRTEGASADLYFHYYSLIQHQCAPSPHCCELQNPGKCWVKL